MITRTSSGLALYNTLTIMELSDTDLPIPVAPATNKCGIFAKFATTGRPLMSLPKPMVSRDSDFINSSDASISLRPIISRCSLGISIPMTGLPGITSTIRTLSTNKALAKSLFKFIIWLTFTPGASATSNCVTTGPGVTVVILTSKPKSLSFSST